MADLSIAGSSLQQAGNRMCSTAAQIPEMPRSSGVSSGSATTDGALNTAAGSLADVLLGIAAEMFRIGDSALACDRTFNEVDRQL